MNNLNIIMCVDNSGGFSKNGSIPWIDQNGKNKYSEDFKHFKKITNGGICVMGRRTYEDMVRVFNSRNKTIGEHILPGRKSYVLSRSGNFDMVGVEHAVDIRQVYEKEKGNGNIYILGGEKPIYTALPFTSHIFLTVLKENYNCDIFFPINHLQKYFVIESGEEKENLYFLKYKRVKYQ